MNKHGKFHMRSSGESNSRNILKLAQVLKLGPLEFIFNERIAQSH